MCDIIEVTDLDAPELDVYARLTQAQLRSRREPEKGIFIAESPKVIGHALDAGCVPLSLLMERRQLEGQGRDLVERCGQVPVYTGDRAVLAGLTGYELTRGILCAMRRPRLPSVEELCARASRVAVLEGIVCLLYTSGPGTDGYGGARRRGEDLLDPPGPDEVTKIRFFP